MTHQEQIIESILKDIKSKKGDWYDKFNNLNKSKRYRIIKDIFINYYSSILYFIIQLDSDIHIHNLGTLNIKPSRKQFLDLKKEGFEISKIVEIVKSSYRELNGKKKNIL
jgi:hypothetical protein